MPKMNRQSAGIASANSTAAAAFRSLPTERMRPISLGMMEDCIIGMPLLDPHDGLRRQRGIVDDRIRHHRCIARCRTDRDVIAGASAIGARAAAVRRTAIVEI